MLQLLTSLAVNAALIAASGDVAQTYRGATAEDRQAIAALHAREAAASEARDLGGISALWTDDVVTLRPGEAPVRGRSANEASLARTLASQEPAVAPGPSIELEEVVVAGDFAYEWGTYRGRLRHAPSADAIQQQVHVLRILARQPDGGWKIARTIYTPSTAGHGRERVGHAEAERTFAELASSLPRLFWGMAPCIER